MSKFKRYGFQFNDPGKDPDEKFVRYGVGVPTKFTETPIRALLKKIFKVLGMICFSYVMFVIPVLICYELGWVHESVMGVIFPTLGVVFFISHLGFFFEMAVDASGRNWFARSAAVFWICFFGIFISGTAWFLIQRAIGYFQV